MGRVTRVETVMRREQRNYFPVRPAVLTMWAAIMINPSAPWILHNTVSRLKTEAMALYLGMYPADLTKEERQRVLDRVQFRRVSVEMDEPVDAIKTMTMNWNHQKRSLR